MAGQQARKVGSVAGSPAGLLRHPPVCLCQRLNGHTCGTVQQRPTLLPLGLEVSGFLEALPREALRGSKLRQHQGLLCAAQQVGSHLWIELSHTKKRDDAAPSS